MSALRPASLLLLLTPLACGDAGTGATEDLGTTDLPATSTGDVPGSTGDLPTTSGTSTSTGTTTGSTTADSTATTDDGTTGAPLDIDACLAAIDGLTVEEADSEVEGYRFFRLEFEQPVDHNTPDGEQFVQRLRLMHRDETAPLVFVTEGYNLSNSQGISEPANLLHANQLRIEHRMFAGSVYPDDDWSTVTIEQSAADHHRVAESVGACYSGPRVATGASKGGMTASYFRRFYPDDVDVTIPYVAPLSYGTTDERYVEFVNNVGDVACRKALADLQREFLLRRPEMLQRLQAQAQADSYSYDLIGEQLTLEIMALELPFTFWQYFDASLCPDIPGQAAGDDDIWAFFDAVMPARSCDDQRLLSFEPYFWQASIQLGGPGIDEAPVGDLLMFPGADVPATYVFTPNTDPIFDPAPMPDIADWIATDAERFLFIYGANDPWTAGAYDPKGNPDVVVLTVPDGNHGSKIGQLSQPDRDLALAKLEEWTGVKPMARDLPPEPAIRDLVLP
jgi:hypothetical protein